MFFDPLYLILALPAMLLGMYAQSRVQGSFNKFSRVRTARGVTGAQVARYLLDSQGLYDVQIERVAGQLTDHYDPQSNILRLSEAVHDSPSVAAAGVAAHEMGHALQDKVNYGPLSLRSIMVPSVRIGSWIGPLIFFAGLFIHPTLAWIGLILFGATAAFALVTLPVEFDASNRAKKLLAQHNIVTAEEADGVKTVLDAAALTYVAAALQAISTLIYYGSFLIGRRD
jgi:Zn-dependent membrane protease YugP